MKKVININFQGRVVPIEESAYDILKQYVESLRKYFANEEGRDEIINDIEGRIAELFGETLKKGNTCITDTDVEVIIASMGRPEDFEGEEAHVKSQLEQETNEQTKNNQQNTTSQTETTARKLYRNEADKVLGGVCSGLANYMNLDPILVRIAFVIMGFGFGFGFLAYFILWIAVPSTSSTVIGGQRKKLFRDAEEKVIAGVCSGLAKYFHISVWIPRVLFLIPFFSFVFNFGHAHFWHFGDFLKISFSPGSAFIYIILWLVLPEAKTTAEKLEMKGEKVDLNNIKNTIQSDLEQFGQKAKNWGEDLGENVSQKAQEFSTVAAEKAKSVAAEANTVVQKQSKGLGDVLLMIVKIFFWFILGSILFAIVCGLFALGVVMTGLIPSWSYVINDGWQSVLAWGTLVLFIWVPVIGIVTFIFRRLTGKRGGSNAVRYGFSILWTLGWVCIITLLSSVSTEFKRRNNPVEETIALSKPNTNQLEVKIQPFKYYNESWFKLSPFASFDDDTVFVRNLRIRIVKSKNDSFSVKLVKISNGPTKEKATELANSINFNIQQIEDSVLMLDKGIALDRQNKFRNQHLILTIAVPVGKKIKINKNVGWDDNINVGFHNDNWDFDNYDQQEGSYRWHNHDTWYEMTNTGLKDLEWNEEKDNNNEESINEFKKSKSALEKDIETQEKELQERKKELEEKKKLLNKNADSTPYKFKPEPQQKKNNSKPAASAKNWSVDDAAQHLLLQKFAI